MCCDTCPVPRIEGVPDWMRAISEGKIRSMNTLPLSVKNLSDFEESTDEGTNEDKYGINIYGEVATGTKSWDQSSREFYQLLDIAMHTKGLTEGQKMLKATKVEAIRRAWRRMKRKFEEEERERVLYFTELRERLPQPHNLMFSPAVESDEIILTNYAEAPASTRVDSEIGTPVSGVDQEG